MIIGNKTSRLTTNLRFGDEVLLIKSSTGEYVDGIYQEGVQETTTMTAHHQPADSDDRQNLPENERLREVKKVWVRSFEKDLIRPMRQGDNNTRGDVLQINDIKYEVYSVDNFSLDGHIMAICVRQEGQSDG